MLFELLHTCAHSLDLEVGITLIKHEPLDALTVV